MKNNENYRNNELVELIGLSYMLKVRDGQKQFLMLIHIIWYKIYVRSKMVKVRDQIKYIVINTEVHIMFGLTPYNRRNNDVARSNDFFDVRSLFEDFLSDSFMPGFFAQGGAVRADIKETEKEYIIDAELPGVKKEDIRLELRDDTLTVSVEKREEEKEERSNYIRQERKYGSYGRSFHVENVKNEAVTAKFENGILTVNLPKDENGNEKKRMIDIQ